MGGVIAMAHTIMDKAESCVNGDGTLITLTHL
jgi:hypothetical protein